ncbi:uncharacterized protein PHALS_05727 [Plasmopara halstedii]|uniref:Uncharacterized protein n=1 Tax=Plasmopara halstedii TaxID=4781 RepID=A0A0N7L447_PLAHL|nr:uncharacterized protein PHALS_05727 [Plasmopara halstedii]CEG37667.1 hypothetical protein PHALS_05727 [Plasmopara halstedii]|eukprot:XP_024574036.1 hypothetical protein PHALS_05727 [Plasmopara halstedii]
MSRKVEGHFGDVQLNACHILSAQSIQMGEISPRLIFGESDQTASSSRMFAVDEYGERAGPPI